MKSRKVSKTVVDVWHLTLEAGQRWWGTAETLYKGDVALSTKPVMLILAPLIPATRWSCSQQSLLSAGGQLQLYLVSGWQRPDKHHIGNV